jgi:sec-independent protein translocase protein TatA
MAGIGVPELLIVLVILLLVFGPKRLPGLGRQLGGGMREFKDSITGKVGDDDDDERPGSVAGLPAPPEATTATTPPPATVVEPAGEHDPAAPPRP